MRESARTDYAKRLLAARKHAGFTQTHLAKLAGMSQSSYGQAETTGVGSSYTPQIARACGVSAEWLAAGKGEMLAKDVWPFHVLTPEQIAALPAAHLKIVEDLALTLLSSKVNPESVSTYDPHTEREGSRKGEVHKLKKGEVQSGERDSNPEKTRRSARGG